MGLPNSRPLRYSLYALIILILVGAGWYFFKPKAEVPQLLTAEATVSDIENTVLASGTIEARKLVSVGSQASGQVKKLYVELGDKVVAGQMIAQIDQLTQQNSLKNAQAALANQQAQRMVQVANLQQSKLVWQRQKNMLAQDATSKADYDTALANYQTAQAQIAAVDAQIKQAQLTVDTAGLNLGYTSITAPMAGTVVAVVAEEGQTVNANQSTPTIIKLANLETLTVKAEISEADVVKVKAGLPVYFTILGNPDQRYYATLRAIEPAPESISTDATTSSSSSTAIYYNGLFDVPNPDGTLRIDMTAQVYIVLDSAKNAVTIPASALSKSSGTGKQTVQVVGADGLPQKREVMVGLNNRVTAQIVSGLKAGDKVVIGEGKADGGASSQSKSGGGRRGPMGF
jgi:membrane fusion protein, macrolide-specific efflux system